ncbi:MAG: DedA family protein, partial [Planctomycetes bacterium]|nr:DedA family protein [Planctomycetota bacterium]
LMPLVLGNRRKWGFYATTCTLGSILGAMVGYAIGMGLWSVLEPYAYQYLGWAGFTPDNFTKVAELYQDYDFLAVFLAGFTPLPFKLFTIAGGVCRINFGALVGASIISRGARFFLVAGLMRAFGAKITPFIEKYFNLLALLFTALLIGGFAVIKYLR